MTGNSLDAVDVVLTDFTDQGRIQDIAGLSVPYPISLRNALLSIRCLVNEDYVLKKMIFLILFRWGQVKNWLI